MTVVDASAVLEILGQSDTGRELENKLAGGDWHAPYLIDIEVVQTLRRWVFSGAITATEAERAIEVFLSFPIIRHRHAELLPRIWKLRNNLSAYDAAYLALAEILGAPLITMDDGLRKAARRRPH